MSRSLRAASSILGSLSKIQGIIDMEERVRAHGLPKDATNLRKLKSMGIL